MIPTLYDFVTGPHFLALPVSLAQGALLKALDGAPLTAEEREIWHQCTGRERYPEGHRFQEVTVIAGARGGKDSRIAAPLAVHEALFGGHEQKLTAGETATIPVVAQDQRATRVAFGYIRDYLELLAKKSPAIRATVQHVFRQEILLTTRVAVTCFACTAKSIRGWSIPVAIMDELAFFRADTGADADVEVQTALRRGMISFGAATRLVKITTPYGRVGVAYQDFQTYFGQDVDDVLVWRASTALMNPTIDQSTLAREQRVDGARFAREYLAEFGEDVEAFLAHVWIEAAIVEGRRELPPAEGLRYIAAVDPSGGGGDAFTLAIVHPEATAAGTRFVQDVMKSWAGSRVGSVNLEAVVAEIAGILQRYGLYRALGDRYAGKWVEQAFRRVGVLYEFAEFDKSKAYLELEPAVAQGRLELLDHPALLRELRMLEKRYKPGGKTPTIDHPKGGHDDHANALALAVARLTTSQQQVATATRESVLAKLGAAGAATLADRTHTGGFFGNRPAPSVGRAERAAIGVPSDAGGGPARATGRSARFWR